MPAAVSASLRAGPALRLPHKLAIRFQVQLLCFVRADVRPPACLIFQAHLRIGKESIVDSVHIF
jgi:hypothetical protein